TRKRELPLSQGVPYVDSLPLPALLPPPFGCRTVFGRTRARPERRGSSRVLALLHPQMGRTSTGCGAPGWGRGSGPLRVGRRARRAGPEEQETPCDRRGGCSGRRDSLCSRRTGESAPGAGLSDVGRTTGLAVAFAESSFQARAGPSQGDCASLAG